MALNRSNVSRIGSISASGYCTRGNTRISGTSSRLSPRGCSHSSLLYVRTTGRTFRSTDVSTSRGGVNIVLNDYMNNTTDVSGCCASRVGNSNNGGRSVFGVNTSTVTGGISTRFKLRNVATGVIGTYTTNAVDVNCTYSLVHRNGNSIFVTNNSSDFSSLTFDNFRTLRTLSRGTYSPFGRDANVALNRNSNVLMVRDCRRTIRQNTGVCYRVLNSNMDDSTCRVATPHPSNRNRVDTVEETIRDSTLDFSSVSCVGTRKANATGGSRTRFLSLRALFSNGSRLSIDSAGSVANRYLNTTNSVRTMFSMGTVGRGLIPPAVNCSSRSLGILSRGTNGVSFVPGGDRAGSIRCTVSGSFTFNNGGTDVVFSSGRRSVPSGDGGRGVCVANVSGLANAGASRRDLGYGLASRSCSGRKVGITFCEGLSHFDRLRLLDNVSTLTSTSVGVSGSGRCGANVMVNATSNPVARVISFRGGTVAENARGNDTFSFPGAICGTTNNCLDVFSNVGNCGTAITGNGRTKLRDVYCTTSVLTSNGRDIVLTTNASRGAGAGLRLCAGTRLLRGPLNRNSMALILRARGDTGNEGTHGCTRVGNCTRTRHPMSCSGSRISDGTIIRIVRGTYIGTNVRTSSVSFMYYSSEGVVGALVPYCSMSRRVNGTETTTDTVATTCTTRLLSSDRGGCRCKLTLSVNTNKACSTMVLGGTWGSRMGVDGATLMANSSENVNGTYTLGLTRLKCSVTIGYGSGLRVTRGTISRVASLNEGTITCGTGATSVSRMGSVFHDVRRSFNKVSILIGGTNIISSTCLLVVGSRSLREDLSVGVGKCFGYTERTSLGVLHGGDKVVVGVSSMDSILTIRNRSICDTAGNTMGTVARALTGRLTGCKVEMGTITPNFVRARVVGNVPRRLRGGCLRTVPRGEFNAIRSITGMIKRLYDSSFSCVANRILILSKKLDL